MLTFKHYLIKAFAVFAFTFASATMATAQENTQTTQPAPTTNQTTTQATTQTKAQSAQQNFTQSVKQSSQWTGKKMQQTKNQVVAANGKVESLQRQARPLKNKIQAKLPKGNLPGETTFKSIMKKTSAPAIFIVLAFIFSVWILGFATSPGRD